MPTYQIRFSGRKLGALGVVSTFYERVEAPDKDAAVLKLYDKYEHISPQAIVELRTRYAITHVNRDGMRTLTFANQGRHHFDTREEAEYALGEYNRVGDLRAKVLGGMADTLAVREVLCYDHGDAIGIYFDK